MKQTFNFSAGPAMIPVEVMRQAHDEFLNWHGMGVSIMEISHRSNEFIEVAKQAELDLRDVLNIPKNYHVLFLPGGARTQFSTIPMNLLDSYSQVAYVHSGLWSGYAIHDAKNYGPINIVADAEPFEFLTIPSQTQWKNFDDAAYLYYADNETVHGLEFNEVPDVGSVPIVVDMSSNLLSRPIDVSRYGLIYACAQKNIGMAGITIVIISDELINRKPMVTTPNMFKYKLQVESESMYNTPPTYSWYMTGLVLQWVKQQGGVQVMAERNQRKANKLYQFIDQHSFYQNKVDLKYRSRMNVVFQLPSKNLENEFVKQSEQAGLIGLKGHRCVGGIRASIYNAMPEKGVDLLIEFMQGFEQQYG
jgi:phosphoserine aminotransferase